MKKFKMFEADETSVDRSIDKKTNKKTPFLDSFAKDLTKMAEEGKLEPVIGREKEVFQVLWVLSRKTKNNPVIIGEAGTGKTSIVEGISQKIIKGDCPPSLKNKRIIYVDMGSLMAGASQQGEFEKRIKTLLTELENNKDIILFIDEIHMMVNPNMAIDAANMFKPALARGEMRLIGATTYNEFRNSIEKDAALDRRFQKVTIDEPKEEETIKILNQIKDRFEDYHNVKYTDDAIVACVKMSGRYIPERFFPDKAIDLMDEVGAKVRLSAKNETPDEILNIEKELITLKKQKEELIKQQNYDAAAKILTEITNKNSELTELSSKLKSPPIEIDDTEVANIVSLKTGIDVSKLSSDDSERLLGMESELKLQVIGQDEAVSKLSKFIRRSRVGLKDPNRPSGVFMFLGSTGTGKTHVVKQLAKYIFGSENDLIRIDMSEYAAPHTVSRLIGAPPSYVGYGEGGQLTEKVRRKPYSIILLDEIEKAHPDVLKIFLQVFDDGHLTDSQGRKVNFKETIIIMTSNVGSGEVKNIITPVGFGVNKASIEENKKDAVKAALHKAFPPEFINRIDEVIIFKSLEKESIYKIIDIEIGKLSNRIKDMGYTMTITDNVKDMLLEVGYDADMGARPLKRAIQTYIEDPIADEILRKHVVDKIEIDYDKNKKKLIINGNLITEKLRRIKDWKSFKLF